MIWEKAKSSHDNLKQKEGEGPKLGEFNARKGWFDNFSERTGFKNVKTGEAASAHHRAADEGQKLLRKSRGRKNICLNGFLMQMKVSYSGRKNATKGFYQKGREPGAGMKAGREGWLPFCVRSVGFMVRTAPIYQAADPQPWREKMGTATSL